MIPHIQGIPLRLKADLSSKTLEAKKQLQHNQSAKRKKDYQPRFLNPTILSFKIERGIKASPEKQK